MAYVNKDMCLRGVFAFLCVFTLVCCVYVPLYALDELDDIRSSRGNDFITCRVTSVNTGLFLSSTCYEADGQRLCQLTPWTYSFSKGSYYNCVGKISPKVVLVRKYHPSAILIGLFVLTTLSIYITMLFGCLIVWPIKGMPNWSDKRMFVFLVVIVACCLFFCVIGSIRLSYVIRDWSVAHDPSAPIGTCYVTRNEVGLFGRQVCYRSVSVEHCQVVFYARQYNVNQQYPCIGWANKRQVLQVMSTITTEPVYYLGASAFFGVMVCFILFLQLQQERRQDYDQIN